MVSPLMLKGMGQPMQRDSVSGHLFTSLAQSHATISLEVRAGGRLFRLELDNTENLLDRGGGQIFSREYVRNRNKVVVVVHNFLLTKLFVPSRALGFTTFEAWVLHLNTHLIRWAYSSQSLVGSPRIT